MYVLIPTDHIAFFAYARMPHEHSRHVMSTFSGDGKGNLGHRHAYLPHGGVTHAIRHRHSDDG